jgi:hypothetical protein
VFRDGRSNFLYVENAVNEGHSGKETTRSFIACLHDVRKWTRVGLIVSGHK